MIGHKHVEVGNLQAHNVLPTAYTSWEDTLTLGVKAPGIQLPQKVNLLQPGDPPNHEPYVPAYKLFFPKGPAETPVNKQFFLTVASRRTFELENRKPYISIIFLYLYLNDQVFCRLCLYELLKDLLIQTVFEHSTFDQFAQHLRLSTQIVF
uniref:Uncharacterized protein n=1 Tax=Timema genevievae TaxID=629358 RepID=A0A7R9PQZ6_TIMGE|nr:unnamed protein product [Timema genevievae]